jgi:hypothetical protein
MLHKKSLIAFSSVLILLLFSSCAKDNPVESESQNVVKRLSKIVTNAGNYNQLYYENGKVAKYETVRNNITELSISLRYDETGKIETEEVIHTGQINDHMLNKYFYDEKERIIRININLFEQNQQKPYGYLAYQYDRDNHANVIEQYDSKNQLFVRIENTYDSNGNVILRKRYANNNALSETTKYEYDDKVDPMKTFQTSYSFRSLGRNNITKIVNETYGVDPVKYESLFNYTYDANGNPIKREMDYSDSNNNSSKTIQEYKYQ